MRGAVGSDQGGGIRMRVQMGDTSPFCAADILHRRARDSSLCGSAEAHASLRRFAEGYTFGNTANLGASAAYHTKTEQRVEDENVLQEHSQLQTASPSTLTSPVPHTFGGGRCVVSVDDFKSRAAACSAAEHADRQRSGQECGDVRLVWEKLHAKERDRECERNVISERCEKGRRRRERGTLLFGDHAVRTPLPVRQRIERRVVPKRLRDTVGVDALTVMIGDMLATTDRHGKKLRCASEERTRNVVDDVNREGVNENERVNGSANDVVETSKGASGHSGATVHHVESANACAGVTNARRTDNLLIGDNDDDGTTDELSFLVQRCDLEPERKQSHFMPYIT